MTSAISSRTFFSSAGSVRHASDSSGVSHWNSEVSSPTSPDKAIARFFGVWNGSQERAAAKSRRRWVTSSKVTGVIVLGRSRTANGRMADWR